MKSSEFDIRSLYVGQKLKVKFVDKSSFTFGLSIGDDVEIGSLDFDDEFCICILYKFKTCIKLNWITLGEFLKYIELPKGLLPKVSIDETVILGKYYSKQEMIEIIKDAVAESLDWSSANDNITSFGIVEKRFLDNWLTEKL